MSRSGRHVEASLPPDGEPGGPPAGPGAVSRLFEALSAQRSRVEAICRKRGGLRGGALHDVRVALRRTAALSRLSRGFPSEGSGEPLLAAARSLRRALSASRSEEVCRSRLARRFGRDAARREAARSLAARLGQPGAPPPPEPADLLAELLPLFASREAELLAAADADGAADRRLSLRLHRRLRRRRRRLLSLGVPERSTLHRFRIATKDFRYGVEFLAGELPGGRDLLKLLRAFQDAAGDAHDREEIVDLVRRRALSSPRDRAGARLLLPTLERDATRAVERARRLSSSVLDQVERLEIARR